MNKTEALWTLMQSQHIIRKLLRKAIQENSWGVMSLD